MSIKAKQVAGVTTLVVMASSNPAAVITRRIVASTRSESLRCEAAIGTAAGPLQASSRTLLARLAPREQIGQFYGLFALSGKLTSFVGPLAVAAVTTITQSQRAGFSALIVFFVVGLGLLAMVANGGIAARR